MFIGALIVLLAQAPLPPALTAPQLAGLPPASQASEQSLIPQMPAIQLEQTSLPQFTTASRLSVRNADLRATLSALAQANDLNLAMIPDITDTVTVDLGNVTLIQALRAILTPRGLQYEVREGLLNVFRPQLETRTFAFDYIPVQRTLSRSGGSPTSLSSSTVTDPFADIQAGMDSLKSEDGEVVMQKQAGLIVATDFAANLEAMQVFLDTVQNAVNRQVVIETRIIEVTLSDSSQGGIDWSTILDTSMTNTPGAGATEPFRIGATARNFPALLNLLSNQGMVNVISSPTVSTMNNQPTVIRSGTQTSALATITEGVMLDVTPQISDDGIITMNIHATITQRIGEFVLDVREADTVVRVATGNTVVISGLISERTIQQGVRTPILGNLPLVGRLFKKTETDHHRSDLVILVTPRIQTIETALDDVRRILRPD